MDHRSQDPHAATTSRQRCVITAGHYRVDRQHRDNWIATFEDLVTRARGAEGAIHIAITADSVDPERVNVLEVWRDSEALDRWRERANEIGRAASREGGEVVGGGGGVTGGRGEKEKRSDAW